MALKNGDFTNFPNSILDKVSEFSGAELRVVSFIASQTGGGLNGGLKAAQRTIAHHAGISINTAKEAIRSLEARGVIVTAQDSSGSVYMLADGVASGGVKSLEPVANAPHRWNKHSRYRQQVFTRDGFKCVYCGSPENLVLDHVIPKSRGGSDKPENLAAACSQCNRDKSDRTPEEWGAAR